MYFKKIALAIIFLFIATFSFAQAKTTVKSPNKNIELNFWLNDKGTPMYSVAYKNKEVILQSAMGFELKQTMSNEALPSLTDKLVIISSLQTSADTKWKPVWGDVKEISENYSQLKISLSQKGDKAINFNIIQENGCVYKIARFRNYRFLAIKVDSNYLIYIGNI